jgi:hypothetical protein
MSEVTYVCSVCHRQVTVEQGQPVPLCCRKEMSPLPFCTSVPNPEMVRSHEGDEPCDDGTLPKKRK